MKKSKIIKLVLKGCGKVLLAVFIMVYVLIALLNTSVMQSFTASKVADYFSKEWHTKVHIGALSITPFINAGLKDVYVEDLSKDTLLYAEYIEANISNFPSSNHIALKNVELDNATCKIVKSKQGKFNFSFITDYFKSNKPKEKKPKKKSFTLEVKDIALNNVNFILWMKNKPSFYNEDRFFAASRMEIRNTYMRVKDFSMTGMDYKANILHISAKERCGINLKEFKGKVHFSNNGVVLHDGLVQTKDSKIFMDAVLKTTRIKTYSYYVDSVYHDVKIKTGSYIDLRDACYWTKRVRDARQKIYLVCDIKGTVNDMQIDAFDMSTGNTHVNVSGLIKKVTDFKNSYYNVQIKDISTSKNDIDMMNLGSVASFSIPKIIGNLGQINLMGIAKGKMDNFITSINATTDLGSVIIDASGEKIGDTPTYTVSISSTRFDVGKFIDNHLIGSTGIDAKASIKGFDIKNMYASADCNLINMYFNGNYYDNLTLKADVDGYDIDANIDIGDESVNVVANGFLNYKTSPHLSVQMDISNMNLHKMHLVDFADTNTYISGIVNADIENFNINNLKGNLTISNVEVNTLDKDYHLGTIAANMINDSSRNFINLSSDIANVNIEGKYTFETIKNDVNHLMQCYIPNTDAIFKDTIYSKSAKKYLNENYIAQSNVNFNAKIKDVNIVKSLFGIYINLKNNVDIEGQISKDSLFACKINAHDFSFAKKDFYNTNLNLITKNDRLNVLLNLDSVCLKDSLGLKNLDLNAKIDSANISLLVNGEKMYDSLTIARIGFDGIVNQNGLQGNFSNTYIDLQGIRVKFNENHVIGIKNKEISLMNLILSSYSSAITLDGMVSKDGTLDCKFDNVDLRLANTFLKSNGISLQGTINKDITFKNLMSSPTFTSSLVGENLTINDVLLGTAWLNVNNSISSDVLNANIKMLYTSNNKSIVPLQLIGTFSPKEKENQLDLDLNMQDFDIQLIKPFISSFASEIEGTLSTKKMYISGKLSSPEIEGTLHCNNVAMKINMLGTKYWINDDINIDGNRVVFDNFRMKDAEDNSIVLNGNVTHNNFKTFDINLRAYADKIKILDTKASSDEVYYGTAYASANMNITGDSSMINIVGNAKTEPGTFLTVPLGSKKNAKDNDFIRFVNNDTTNVSDALLEDKMQKSSLGYNIDIDLNVNPSAKLFIPMDFNQLRGDLLAAGNGDLKVVMGSDGKFSMVGEVAIAQGKFELNIMDMLNKPFILQEGGTLTWNGKPAEGVLDLAAIYKTKASLSSILGEAYSKPVDVESIIRLSGPMTNPQPAFDINLPNTDKETTEQLFMNIDKSDEKVMLEQTASILLTGQFYSSNGSYQTEALQSGISSSVMGVALSQLNGIVNNMVKFVDVSLNYTSGSEGNQLSNQVGANISRTFGKWELNMNASYGGSSTSTYSTSETSNIIGDMSAKYKFTDNLQFEVFNKSNANDFTKYNISPYTQGAKLIYKRDYNSFRDIFRKHKRL